MREREERERERERERGDPVISQLCSPAASVSSAIVITAVLSLSPAS